MTTMMMHKATGREISSYFKLMTTAVALAGFYGIHRIVNQSDVLVFPVVSQKKSSEMFMRLKSAAARAFNLVCTWLFVAVVLYLLRAVPGRVFGFGGLLNTYALFLSWELIDVAVHVVLTEPVHVYSYPSGLNELVDTLKMNRKLYFQVNVLSNEIHENDYFTELPRSSSNEYSTSLTWTSSLS